MTVNYMMSGPSSSKNQREKKQYDENVKQNFSDPCSGPGDTADIYHFLPPHSDLSTSKHSSIHFPGSVTVIIAIIKKGKILLIAHTHIRQM